MARIIDDPDFAVLVYTSDNQIIPLKECTENKVIEGMRIIHLDETRESGTVVADMINAEDAVLAMYNLMLRMGLRPWVMTDVERYMESI